LPVNVLNIETKFHTGQIFQKKSMIFRLFIELILIRKTFGRGILHGRIVPFRPLAMLFSLITLLACKTTSGQAGSTANPRNSASFTHPISTGVQPGPGWLNTSPTGSKPSATPRWHRSIQEGNPSFLRASGKPSAAHSWSQQQQAPALALPPVPLGFFCRWEDRLARKLPLPLDFGTD
jgi:hypothetical protein